MGEFPASEGVWFPQWTEALARLRLPEWRRQAYRRALIKYLRFCKVSHQRASVASARKFMAQVEAQRRLGVSQVARWKEALNWFFGETRNRPSTRWCLCAAPPGGRSRAI